MMARVFSDGAPFLNRGSRGVLQHRLMISISLAGSDLLLRAHNNSSVLLGSISSSTTTVYLPRFPPAWQPLAYRPACLAWPGYLCLIDTMINIRPPADGWHQTPRISGTPAASISLQSMAERLKLVTLLGDQGGLPGGLPRIMGLLRCNIRLTLMMGAGLAPLP